MRLKPYKYAILVMGWALMCSISVSAQEGRSQEGRSQGEFEAAKETPRNEPDPILSSDSEARAVNKATAPITSSKETVRDSVQVKIQKPATKTAEKDHKGEDPLSFNFLYYIIERFKLSDIIE